MDQPHTSVRQPDTPACVVVSTTVETETIARELAREIVDARLAACAQQVPIHSTYRWKGTVESAGEILLLCKTTHDRSEALTAFIQQHHPYEVPEILVTPITGGYAPYLAWLREAVREEKKEI